MLQNGKKAMQEVCNILKEIIGERDNYYLAKAYVGQSEICILEKNLVEAEELASTASKMIEKIYGEESPCMTEFNYQLVEIIYNV